MKVLRKQSNFYMLILWRKDPVIFIGGVALILLEGLGLPIYKNLHTFWIFFEWRKRSCGNFNSLHYDGLKPAERPMKKCFCLHGWCDWTFGLFLNLFYHGIAFVFEYSLLAVHLCKQQFNLLLNGWCQTQTGRL